MPFKTDIEGLENELRQQKSQRKTFNDRCEEIRDLLAKPLDKTASTELTIATESLEQTLQDTEAAMETIEQKIEIINQDIEILENFKNFLQNNKNFELAQAKLKERLGELNWLEVDENSPENAARVSAGSDENIINFYYTQTDDPIKNNAYPLVNALATLGEIRDIEYLKDCKPKMVETLLACLEAKVWRIDPSNKKVTKFLAALAIVVALGTLAWLSGLGVAVGLTFSTGLGALGYHISAPSKTDDFLLTIKKNNLLTESLEDTNAAPSASDNKPKADLNPSSSMQKETREIVGTVQGLLEQALALYTKLNTPVKADPSLFSSPSLKPSEDEKFSKFSETGFSND